eukprot:m.192936 g.192936  ORF g.192936 m.192936 type:complete len:311 (-) comp14870_c0_seq1:204-1136(-)
MAHQHFQQPPRTHVSPHMHPHTPPPTSTPQVPMQHPHAPVHMHQQYYPQHAHLMQAHVQPHLYGVTSMGPRPVPIVAGHPQAYRVPIIGAQHAASGYLQAYQAKHPRKQQPQQQHQQHVPQVTSALPQNTSQPAAKTASKVATRTPSKEGTKSIKVATRTPSKEGTKSATKVAANSTSNPPKGNAPNTTSSQGGKKQTKQATRQATKQPSTPTKPVQSEAVVSASGPPLRLSSAAQKVAEAAEKLQAKKDASPRTPRRRRQYSGGPANAPDVPTTHKTFAGFDSAPLPSALPMPRFATKEHFYADLDLSL